MTHCNVLGPIDETGAEQRSKVRGPAAPIVWRYRIRFRKEGLLRFISHNDLLRTWRRLLRRTGLKVRPSQGFHALTKVSSPVPLALGLEGTDEALEIELTEDIDPTDIQEQLSRETVEGLSVTRVERVPSRRSRVSALEYDCRIEGDFAQSEIGGLRDRFLASPSWIVERLLPGQPPRRIDIRSKVETIAIDAHRVRFRIRVDNGSTVRPEEVLAALGLSQAIRDGRVSIVRTRVELIEPQRAT